MGDTLNIHFTFTYLPCTVIEYTYTCDNTHATFANICEPEGRMTTLTAHMIARAPLVMEPSASPREETVGRCGCVATTTCYSRAKWRRKIDVATVRCTTMPHALGLQRQSGQSLRVCVGGEHSQRRVHEKRFGGQAGVATNSHGCCSAAATGWRPISTNGTPKSQIR